MWRTPQGTRVLVDAEARLFKLAVLLLKESIEDSLDIHDVTAETGVLSFDWMQPEEKLIALATVAKGLLHSKTQAKTLLHWQIATTYAVYANLKTAVDVEIDLNRSQLRRAVVKAYLSRSDALGEYDTVMSAEDDDSEEWEERIDTLAALVVDIKKAVIISKGAPAVTSNKVEAAERFLESLR